MQSAITRLALFQFLSILYSILGVGLVIKLNLGNPAPQIFATHLRDYGFLLLLFPAAWLIFASVTAHRPRRDTGDIGPIIVSGLVLLGLLVCLAVIGTISALRPGSLVQGVPVPHSQPHDSR
jgi:hypothetical protein